MHLGIIDGCLNRAPSLRFVRDTIEGIDFTDNYIDIIPRDYFMGCKRLKVIRLISNRLHAVPFMVNVAGTLRQFELTDNRITDLTNLYNVQLNVLQVLRLKGNLINSVDFSALHMCDLVYLSLGNNNLTEISGIRFLALTPRNETMLLVEVNPNPWHCDVMMTWVAGGMGPNPWKRGEWVYQRPGHDLVIVDATQTICRSPAELHGIRVVRTGKLKSYNTFNMWTLGLSGDIDYDFKLCAMLIIMQTI